VDDTVIDAARDTARVGVTIAATVDRDAITVPAGDIREVVAGVTGRSVQQH